MEMGRLPRDVEQNRETVTKVYFCTCHGVRFNEPIYPKTEHQQYIGWFEEYAESVLKH